MLKIEQLYYLTQVAKYNSINKAAESLYITKAAVSSSIKQLEKDCGYPMLERTYRGVRLTENGERAVKMAEQVLSLCEEIEGLGNEKVEQNEKCNLIIMESIFKLLSSKIIGPKSKVIDWFTLTESNESVESICDLLDDNTIALITLTSTDLQKIKCKEGIIWHEIYKSKVYPFSNKHTKWVPEQQKKLSKEELAKLPQIVIQRDTLTIQKEENIVLETRNADIYEEAILNDYGIGILTKFAPEVAIIDYKMFKIYEPLEDAEVFIGILSSKLTNMKDVLRLRKLIKDN